MDPPRNEVYDIYIDLLRDVRQSHADSLELNCVGRKNTRNADRRQLAAILILIRSARNRTMVTEKCKFLAATSENKLTACSPPLMCNEVYSRREILRVTRPEYLRDSEQN